MPSVSEAIVHGYPIKAPMLDIHTVGAGGGSIAYIDGGLLKVGPRSAGAYPGRFVTVSAAPSRPLPTPMFCSACSTRAICWAAA